jgi:hypothetical protein
MAQLNFMVHCGGEYCNVADLSALPDPTPMSKTHYPIRHDEFFDLVKDQFGVYGLETKQEVHALSHEANRYFGMAEFVRNGSGGRDDYSLIAAWRNAGDQAFSAGLAGGSGCFCCDNLALLGEITVGRKHTRHIMRQLPGLIGGAVLRLKGEITKLDQRYDAYKEYDLRDSWADALIMQMYRRGIINVQRIAKVAQEWDEPSFDDFADDRNMWRLFNAATHVLKPATTSALQELPAKTAKLHTLADEICGISF